MRNSGAQRIQGVTLTAQSRGGVFACRGRRWRRGSRRNCSPYCRTIAAAGFSRIPTPPRSLTYAHSAAMRRTTSSAVNIGAICHLDTQVLQATQLVVLNASRPQAYRFSRRDTHVDIWRTAALMLKSYGRNPWSKAARAPRPRGRWRSRRHSDLARDYRYRRNP